MYGPSAEINRLLVIITTEFHYCSAVSRNYGGKTREIIIINRLFVLRCSCMCTRSTVPLGSSKAWCHGLSGER